MNYYSACYSQDSEVKISKHVLACKMVIPHACNFWNVG